MLKSTIETIAKGVKYVESQQQRHVQNVVVLVSALFTLNIFALFSSVSIVDSEQTNVYWTYILACLTETKEKKIRKMTKALIWPISNTA